MDGFREVTPFVWHWNCVMAIKSRFSCLADLITLAMHTAWPRLLRRMQANKAGTGPEDRELIVAARTWFCAYVFEHQYVRRALSRLLRSP
jgi:hypothetical protein